jgi:hypothetical protein
VAEARVTLPNQDSGEILGENQEIVRVAKSSVGRKEALEMLKEMVATVKDGDWR